MPSSTDGGWITIKVIQRCRPRKCRQLNSDHSTDPTKEQSGVSTSAKASTHVPDSSEPAVGCSSDPKDRTGTDLQDKNQAMECSAIERPWKIDRLVFAKRLKKRLEEEWKDASVVELSIREPFTNVEAMFSAFEYLHTGYLLSGDYDEGHLFAAAASLGMDELKRATASIMIRSLDAGQAVVLALTANRYREQAILQHAMWWLRQYVHNAVVQHGKNARKLASLPDKAVDGRSIMSALRSLPKDVFVSVLKAEFRQHHFLLNVNSTRWTRCEVTRSKLDDGQTEFTLRIINKSDSSDCSNEPIVLIARNDGSGGSFRIRAAPLGFDSQQTRNSGSVEWAGRRAVWEGGNLDPSIGAPPIVGVVDSGMMQVHWECYDGGANTNYEPTALLPLPRRKLQAKVQYGKNFFSAHPRALIVCLATAEQNAKGAPVWPVHPDVSNEFEDANMKSNSDQNFVNSSQSGSEDDVIQNKLQVPLSCDDANQNTSGNSDSGVASAGHAQSYSRDSDGYLTIGNVEPTWSDAVNAYTLNFHGRVLLASKKNFLIGTTDRNFCVLFGKRSKNKYALDCVAPFSVVTAFMVALTQFNHSFGLT